MARLEFFACYYRDAHGTIREAPFPEGEPEPYDVPADLYCASYSVEKGLFRPARVVSPDITIFNARNYRPDLELEEYVRNRLVEAILGREEMTTVRASGGTEAIRKACTADTFWREP